MRPVFPSDLTAPEFEDELLFCDIKDEGERLVTKSVLEGPSRVRTPGGLALPLELWYMIIDNLQKMKATPKYCLVKAKVLPSADGGVTNQILCIRQELTGCIAGSLVTAEQVEAFQMFLDEPTPETLEIIQDKEVKRQRGLAFAPADTRFSAQETALPNLKLRERHGPDSRFLVSRDDQGITARRGTLYMDLKVADVIAYLEGGNCATCGGTRHICPCCARTTLDDGIYDDLLIHCGAELACPLCLGPQIREVHAEYLKTIWTTGGFEAGCDASNMAYTIGLFLRYFRYTWKGVFGGTFNESAVLRPESSNMDVWL